MALQIYKKKKKYFRTEIKITLPTNVHLNYTNNKCNNIILIVRHKNDNAL